MKLSRITTSLSTVVKELPAMNYPSELLNTFAHSAEQTASSSQLADCISQVFIIAYKESTQLLEEALTREGLHYEVLRQEHKAEFKDFSSSYLCLLNHQQAWEKATKASKPTLIVEADFVPVVGFGKLPLPFDSHQENVGVSWLYTCAPQVYSVSQDGYAEGFSTAMVAYIVTARAAYCLWDLAEEIDKKFGATNYSSWDSEIDYFLRSRSLKNYIAFQNYGEHGGLPNPEHHQHGLSKSHRADVLYGKLAFLPLYASGKRGQMKLLSVRFQARLKGIARLVTGRFLRLRVLKGSSTPIRLLSFAVRRHLTIKF